MMSSQHTTTEEQHNNRNRFLRRSRHHCRPKHSWIQWTFILL